MTSYVLTASIAIGFGALIIGAIALALAVAPTLNGIAG